MFGKNKPKRQEYEQMADTPYITQARDLENIGYQGLKDNVGNVNLFDDATKRSLQNVVDNYSNYANDQLNQNYRKQVADLNNQNYGRFGTTNATGALYNSDMLGQQFNNLASANAYNASNMYQNLFNSELRNRYDTLDEYQNLYDKEGQKAYDQDLANYKIRNENKDIQYQNAMQNYNSKNSLMRGIGNTLGGALTLVNPALGAGVTGLSNSMFGNSDDSLNSFYNAMQNVQQTRQAQTDYDNYLNTIGNIFGNNQSNETGSLNNNLLSRYVRNYQSPVGNWGLKYNY